MPSRVAVAQIVWGSKEVWWALRAASTASKAASKEGSKSATASATATPAPAAPAPAAPARATNTRTKTATTTVKPEPKPVPVSPALKHFMGGVAESTRVKAVKHVWEYIREHHLQDSTNKSSINCDDKLKAVLGKDRVHFTEIFGLLNPHFPKKEVKKGVKKS